MSVENHLPDEPVKTVLPLPPAPAKPAEPVTAMPRPSAVDAVAKTEQGSAGEPAACDPAAQRQDWVVMVMGVSGCGKSSLGSELARQMDARFVEADDFHSEQSIEKMSSGVALTDADRAQWLLALNATLREFSAAAAARGEDSRQVLACSALKDEYRSVLACGIGNFFIVYLKGDIGAIAPRLKARSEHFMPVSLLESQFATLEEPTDAFCIPVSRPLPQAVAEVIEELASHGVC